jgi:uncharacterized protein (UPF0371 family)
MQKARHFVFRGRTGFDAKKYAQMQSREIVRRAEKFSRMYIEFGGKLVSDYHAARVLPGYSLDAKMEVAHALSKKRKIEFLMCVSAKHLAEGKRMGALGMDYAQFTNKMIGEIEGRGFSVPNVCVTMFGGQKEARDAEALLSARGRRIHHFGMIRGYPSDMEEIASPDGFGQLAGMKPKSPITIVTGAGPNSGKMSVSLAMCYNDYMRGNDSGYAKFESFPVWNLPLSSPINAAYEAATADLGDYNLVDPYHRKAYGKTAINYNRDVENFQIIQMLIGKLFKDNPMALYRSPTDMGINMVGLCMTDQKLCEAASVQEIIRRYFSYVGGPDAKKRCARVKEIMRKYKIRFGMRDSLVAAEGLAKASGKEACAICLQDGRIAASCESGGMDACALALLNAAGMLCSPKGEFEAIPKKGAALSIQDALLIISNSGPRMGRALSLLNSCDLHSTRALLQNECGILRELGMHYASGRMPKE